MIVIVTSIISGYYYIKVIKVMYFEAPSPTSGGDRDTRHDGPCKRGGALLLGDQRPCKGIKSIIIGMISLVIILYITSPEEIYNSIQVIT